VVNDIETRFKNDATVGIAYIYCDFQRKDDQTISDLISNLVKQLARSQPSLPKTVIDLYDRYANKQTRPLLSEISKVLQSLTVLYSRVFIIIDALDECQTSDGCRAKLLSEMFDIGRRNGTNIFATSRFIPEITNQFKDDIWLEIRASKEDVKQYLEGRKGKLPSFVHQSPELQMEITDIISEAVDGMYVLHWYDYRRNANCPPGFYWHKSIWIP
jgi:hypothetical protein